MTIDNERQRDILLAVLNSATFQGEIVEEVAALKAAVRTATVPEAPTPDPLGEA